LEIKKHFTLSEGRELKFHLSLKENEDKTVGFISGTLLYTCIPMLSNMCGGEHTEIGNVINEMFFLHSIIRN
jgi:hypothetical protein